MKSFLIIYTVDGARYYDRVEAVNHADAIVVFELQYALSSAKPKIETVQYLNG